MRRVAALALLPLALIGAKDDPLAGRVAGTPVDCIDLDTAQGPDIVDSTTILYRESGKRIWKVSPTDACPSLRPMSTMIVDVFGGRLCRNDRFRTVETGMSIPSASCRFGQFTPYDKR